MEVRRPYATYLLLAVNGLVYAWMLYRFGTTESQEALLATGANFSFALAVLNEWWRLVTAAFIHIGAMHLGMNMLTLYFMGMELEEFIGPLRLILLYLGAGIGGNLLSAAMSTHISAGASTALFGMFASYLVLSRLYPSSMYLKQRARSFTLLIIINVINSLLATGVDLWGHMGGLVFGGLLTFVLGGRVKTDFPSKNKILVLILLLLLTVLLIYLILHRNYQIF